MSGPTLEKIIVTIVDANDNSISALPLTVKPPVETEKLIKRLVGGHGAGALLDKHGDLVLDEWLKQAGNYKYRVTGESAVCGGLWGVFSPVTGQGEMTKRRKKEV